MSLDASHQNLLNETVYQWYADHGVAGCFTRVIEIFPEFGDTATGESKMRSKIASLAHTVKTASVASRRDLLSKPFKPPGTRLLRLRRSEDEDDDDSNEESPLVVKRKSANRGRVNYNVASRTLTAYDADGGLNQYKGFDLCDCLEASCPGCHFPCPRCGSEKCGNDCRIRRKWTFEYIEIEGTDFKVKFPHLP